MRKVEKMGFERKREPRVLRPGLSVDVRDYLATREARRRYRFMMLDRPAAPWRRTIHEAQRDAIRAGEAHRDEHSVFLYFGVFAWIDMLELADDQLAA